MQRKKKKGWFDKSAIAGFMNNADLGKSSSKITKL